MLRASMLILGSLIVCLVMARACQATPDTNQSNSVNNQDNSLLLAIRRGDSTDVANLLASGADANCRDQDGHTALMLAVMAGKSGIAKLLLDDGASLFLKSSSGATALMYASDLDTINVLLDKGAGKDTFSVNKLLMLCTGSLGGGNLFPGKDQLLNVIRLLINRGADVNFKDPISGNTALMQAWGMDGDYVLNYAPPSSISLLLASGANPNIANNEGETPLIRAVYKHDLFSTQLLLSHGANPNLKDSSGRTALIALADSPIDKCYWRFAPSDFEVSYNVWDSSSKIFEAAPVSIQDPAVRIAQLLIKHGAKVNTMDKVGRSALSHELEKRFPMGALLGPAWGRYTYIPDIPLIDYLKALRNR